MDIGTILIWISLLLCIAVPLLTVLHYYTKERYFRIFAIIATLACVLAITIAYFLLTYYFLTSNFDIHYVWYNSSNSVEWYLKITGTWAGQEGSLLLWVWIILAVLGIEEFIQFRRRRKFQRSINTDENVDENDQVKENPDSNSILTYDLTRVIVMLVVVVFLILTEWYGHSQNNALLGYACLTTGGFFSLPSMSV